MHEMKTDFPVYLRNSSFTRGFSLSPPKALPLQIDGPTNIVDSINATTSNFLPTTRITTTSSSSSTTTTTAAAAIMTASNRTIPRRNKRSGVSSEITTSAVEQRRQSQAGNKKLINLIRRRPWLYDGAHQDYAKKDIVEKTWKQIGRSCNDSAASCKERWRNIRAAFARSINLYKTQAGPNRVKPYYLHQELKFLIEPMTKGRRSQASWNSLASPSTSTNDDEHEITFSSDEQDESSEKNFKKDHEYDEIVQARGEREQQREPQPQPEPTSEPVMEREPQTVTTAPEPQPEQQQEPEHEENRNDAGMQQIIACASTIGNEMVVIPQSNSGEIVNSNWHAPPPKRHKVEKFENHSDNSTNLFVKSLFYDMESLTVTQKYQLKKLIYEAFEAFSSQSDHQSTVVLKLVQTTTTKTTAMHAGPIPLTTTSMPFQQQPSSSITSSSSSSPFSTAAGAAPARSTPATVPHSLTAMQKHIMTHVNGLNESQLQQLDNFIVNVLMPPMNEMPNSASLNCCAPNVLVPTSDITMRLANSERTPTIKNEPLEDLVNSNFNI